MADDSEIIVAEVENEDSSIEPLAVGEIKEGQNESFSSEAIEQLSQGIMNLHEPDVSSIHDRVKELLQNQGVLRDSTQNELTQLQECSMLSDINETFEHIKLHHKKLVTMKKDMSQLLDRIQKTKIRAQKLQLQKEKEELEVAKEKERQRTYENELMAKPAAEYTMNPSGSSS